MSQLGTKTGFKLRGVEVLCSKILKNWNINIRGCQQCIISVNFLIICIFYFEKKNHKWQFIIKSFVNCDLQLCFLLDLIQC